jgi:hypothetical protein
MGKSHEEYHLPQADWTPETRLKTAAPGLDGVFVLRKGFLKASNTPIAAEGPASAMSCSASDDGGALLMLFLALHGCLQPHRTFLPPPGRAARDNATNRPSQASTNRPNRVSSAAVRDNSSTGASGARRQRLGPGQ